MDTLVYICIIAFILAVAVIYFWFKSRTAASIAESKSKLDSEIKARNELERRLALSVAAAESADQKAVAAEQQKAVLSTHLQHAEDTQAGLRQLNQDLQQQVEKLNESIGQFVREKAVKEAELASVEKNNSQLQQREKQWVDEIAVLRRTSETLKEDNATLRAKNEETLLRLQEQQDFLQKANDKLKDTFHVLSAEALKSNNESFVTLAKSALETQVTEAKGELDKKQQAIDSLVKPLTESLGKFDTKMQELEKVRSEQHGQINQYIQGIQQTTEKLQKETQSLVSALKTSHGRGRYGEIALRRVVEVAGMTEHCDFEEQVSVASEDGKLRPDMVIRLPERKAIVVDSKVPLAAYMRAFETENEEERKALLAQHAVAVRDHLKRLSEKAYWSQFPDSPDWVVLYMQIESSFGTALQTDPALVEDAIKNRVIFATPTTLITLLRTVGFVWQQVSIAENIEQIRDAGIELYERTATLFRHFSQIGGGLKTAVASYNSAVASLETRFLPQARKIQVLGSAYTKNMLPEARAVELSVRELIIPDDQILKQDDSKQTIHEHQQEDGNV